MKFFNWMQNKFNGGKADRRPIVVPPSNHTINDPPKEEFSDWPHGLLAIGTFGNNEASAYPTNTQQGIIAQLDRENEAPHDECFSPDFSEFTAEEVNSLQKELKKLLNRKHAASNPPENHHQDPIADLPLDRFLNCPSSLEVDRTASNRFSTYSDNKDEEEIDRTIRIILGRCKDVCENKKGPIGKKSISFLVKRMFACRSGFVPTPSFRDTFQESRMEKLMRTMLTKKIYPQNASRASSTKKYIEECRQTSKKKTEEEILRHKTQERSKWDKTDSEYIVLEI